jgi:hypothetical protein
MVFVHASPSLPSLRLCWGLPGSTQLPYPSSNEMPASNYAGIPVGGAVWLSDTSSPLPMFGETIYAVRAKIVAEIAPTSSCSDLICPSGGRNCLMLNADYWPVGFIAPGQVQPGETNIVAVAGCLNHDDPLASVDRCGPTWNPATGNLHLDVVPIAGTFAVADAGGTLMVQAAQLSPGLQSLQGDSGPTVVSFGSQGDASTIAQLAQEDDLLPATPVAVSLQGGLAAYGQLGFGVDVPGAGAGSAGHLWMSLAQAQDLVSPAQDPSVYYAGGPYVVAVVGDPYAPHAFAGGDGGYDGKGLHVLVLPTAGQAPP